MEPEGIKVADRITNTKLKLSTKDKLDILKKHPSESYDSVVSRLIVILEKYRIHFKQLKEKKQEGSDDQSKM